MLRERIAIGLPRQEVAGEARAAAFVESAERFAANILPVDLPAAPDAVWLNRILAIGRGTRDNKAVKIEVFEVL